MELALIVLALTIGLSILIFSVLVKRKKPDEYWNWWISLIATIVSVMLGVGVGIFLFEYSQDRTKSHEKERLTSALVIELSEIYNVLGSSKKFTIKGKNQQEVEVLLVTLDQITVNDAIRSNLFDEEATTQLIYISRNIRMLDSGVNNLWAFLRERGIYNVDDWMKRVRTNVLNIEKYQDNIKKSIEALERLLNRNFTKKRT